MPTRREEAIRPTPAGGARVGGAEVFAGTVAGEVVGTGAFCWGDGRLIVYTACGTC